MTQTIMAQGKLHALTDDIVEVHLFPQQFIPYVAGQYLQIAILNQSLSFSIANAPLKDDYYELHFRHEKDNAYHQALIQHIQQGDSLEIQLPFGECHFAQLRPKPTLYIAGGTGFAPIQALIDQQAAVDPSLNIQLFWLVRSKEDLYKKAKLSAWAKNLTHFSYDYFFSRNTMPQPLTQYLTSMPVLTRQEYQIVIAGPFDMVWFIHDALLDVGIEAKQLFSDAFHFPRGG